MSRLADTFRDEIDDLRQKIAAWGLPAEARSEAEAERVDQRWHHPRSFLLGFLPTVIYYRTKLRALRRRVESQLPSNAAARSSSAIALPTRALRPTTTASSPLKLGFASFASSTAALAAAERANENLDAWLRQAKNQVRIRYRDEATGEWVSETEVIESAAELVELYNPADIYAAFAEAGAILSLLAFTALPARRS